MKRLCVAIITILLSPHALGDTAPGSSATPQNRPITVTDSEEGETESHEVGTTARAEALYPTNWGHAGTFRVRSAESLPQGALTFGIGGEFYSISNAPAIFAAGNQEASTIAESLFVGYAPVKDLTIGVQRRNSSTTFGQPQQLISSLGDFNFSGLYSIPVSPSIAIAPVVNILVASNFNNLAPSGTTLSAGLGAAMTYSLFPMTGLPLFAHANLIYHMPQIRTSKLTTVPEPESYFNFSRYHTLTWGLGAELKMGDFIPFLELQQTVHTSSGLSFGGMPSRLTLGTRITPIDNKSLAILLGTDIGLGKGLAAGVPFSPGYQIIGQVSYTVGLSGTERKHYHTTSDVNVVDRKFVIRKNVKFRIGSAELDPESAGLLDQIAEVVRENHVRKLLIVGHTDSSHGEDYNLKLSQDRAGTVKRYLVARGISEETFMAQGYGRRKPKASNLTEEGRAQNRRVEFFILE